MKKISLIIFILLLFFVFIFINIHNSFNSSNNSVENYDILSYTNKELCEYVAKNTNISLDDIYVVAYLSDDSTKIKIKNGVPVDKNLFDRYLKIAKQKDFRLYNETTNKYHTLSCKYALKMHKYSIYEKSKLPANAIPCKFCCDKTLRPQLKTKIKNNICCKLILSSQNIKIILTDFTTCLKPTRECKSNICKELLSDIKNAKSTIDIAIYGYDKVPEIEFALSNALKRGVKIRLIYDVDSKGNNIYANTNYIAELIKDSKNDASIDVKYSNSIMHDKFYIFDSKKVVTGSANLSFTDMSGFNSNSVIVINSPKIAKIYENEFNQMYEGKFHEQKSKINKEECICVDNSKISVYFSPSDNVINKTVIPLINTSKKYIYIPSFLITDKYFARSLVEARKRGVDVKVIIDAVNAKSKSSKHQFLRDNGILVKTENYAGKLHSKSIIIDDYITIIGSMNFSYSGNFKNDENLIVLKNKNFAIFYRKFFEYLWSKNYDFWLKHDVSAESKYSVGSCSDGIDNDYDGKVDLEDEGCFAN